MFKKDKSILIVCIISLFLLISQAAAADADSIGLNDSNQDHIELNDFNQDSIKLNDYKEFNSLEIDNQNPDADSIELWDDGTSKNGFNTNAHINSIDDDLSIDNQEDNDDNNDNIDNNDNDDNDDNNDYDNNKASIIIEERAKDTDGVVMAEDNYSCGPASLATVLNKFGMNLSLSEVSKHTNTSLNGTSMQSLIDAARYYKFSAVGVEIDTDKLKENNIVHLNINGNEHWTVISKITDTHVFLADSTEGNMNFSIDEFNSYFTQKAIILSNGSQSNLNNEIIANQIKILDKKQASSIYGKGMKRRVVGYKTVWKYGMIAKYGWVLRPVVSGGHVSFSQWKYVKGTYYVWGKYKVKEPIYKYYYVSDDALTSAKIKKTKK